MGYRRVFRRVADALGDQRTLTAKLLSCGLSWHEVRISGVQHLGLGRWTAALSNAVTPGARPADRSLRTDQPEDASAKTRQPNYLVRRQQMAADE